MNDDRWMALALSLGRRGLGRVWPNPAVGCVIGGALLATLPPAVACSRATMDRIQACITRAQCLINRADQIAAVEAGK